MKQATELTRALLTGEAFVTCRTASVVVRADTGSCMYMNGGTVEDSEKREVKSEMS